jgi:hypothetical protein
MKAASILISNWFSELDLMGKGFVVCVEIWLIVRISAAIYDHWDVDKTGD